MNYPFALESFDKDAPIAEALGCFEVLNKVLKITFSLKGDFQNYQIDSDHKLKNRVDGLWRETCFEFFIKQWNKDQYIEVNLSSSGAWQSYHFENYRHGMSLFKGIEFCDYSFEQKDNELQFSASFELKDDSFWNHKDYNLGTSIVLLKRPRGYDYLALLHLGEEADFHCPESFNIKFNL